ncbi:MAG: right-handed parallel beta-helix repeat-containing protein, partial [Verrucomicrobia bacterium]
PSIVYYVDPNYVGTETGSSAQPFNSLAEARDQIRADTSRTSDGVSALPGWWDGAKVVLKDGVYDLSATRFTLDERDRGSAAYPVLYVADTGATPVFTGAHQVSDSAWKRIVLDTPVGNEVNDSSAWARMPAAAKSGNDSFVYRLDVNALSIDKGSIIGDYGAARDYLMLLDSGAIKQWSAWPAGALEDAASWVNMDAASGTSWNAPATITFSETTPLGWNINGQNLLMYGACGLFGNPPNDAPAPWWFSFEEVDGISGSGSTTISITDYNGPYRVDFDDARGFLRLCNAMEAITEGATVWWHTNGYLYYWPAGGSAPTDTSLTLNTEIVQLGVADDPSQAPDYVHFRGIVFEGTRDRTIGIYETTGTRFESCTFRACSGHGPFAEGVYALELVGCTVSDIASTGFLIRTAGDKATLTESGTSITTSTFSNLGWGVWGQNKAALALGEADSNGNVCGVTVSGNTFQDCYTRAVLVNGALVTIDNNTFTRVVRLTGDAAAVSDGRKVTDVGIVVSNNTFTDIVRHPRQNASYGAIFGVYMDDCLSWSTITDNHFLRCDSAIQVASGKGTTIARNVFDDCDNNNHACAVVLAYRAGFTTTFDAELAQYLLEDPPWSTLWPLVKEQKSGGQLRDYLNRFWFDYAGVNIGIKFVDNVLKSGSYLYRTTGPVDGDIVQTQLQYPAGYSGTPVEGGGSVLMSTMKRP